MSEMCSNYCVIIMVWTCTIAVDIMFNRVYLLTMHISYCLIIMGKRLPSE